MVTYKHQYDATAHTFAIIELDLWTQDFTVAKLAVKVLTFTKDVGFF